MNFIGNRNFRAGPQTSLEGFICPQNSDKQQKIKVFGRSVGGNVKIGDNLCVGRNSIIEAWTIKDVDSFSIPHITIGNNVSLGEYCHITAISKIEIGNNLLTGRFVTITDNSHGFTDYKSLKLPPLCRSVISKGHVVIHDNVWIGDKVTILPNVTIGEGEEGFHIHVVLDFLEDGVGDILRDMLHPEGLFHLAASPFVVLYLVVDEESGKALIVDELLLGQEFHVSGDGILWEFPLLHLVEHFLRAMFGLCAEGSELQQSLLLCHRLLGALGLVVIFHNAFNFIVGIGGYAFVGGITNPPV